jgi:uncharacterized protein YjiS (DUF1127 family)
MAIALHHPLTKSHRANSHRVANAKPSPIARFAASAARLYRLWQERQRDLRAIADLDERDLRDIGMSRYALRQELAKPFWRS